MELDEFIKETLCQIVKGVVLAQDATKNHGAIINPKDYGTDTAIYTSREGREFAVQKVDFELGLTEISNNEKKTGIGVMFNSVGIGFDRKNSGENSSISNIKFSIPIKLPCNE